MFTGIVQTTGRIEALERYGDSLRLTVSSLLGPLDVGESVSVDGVCLTVVAPTPLAFQADLSVETLRVSIAGDYEVGSVVNLERALRVGDRVGGHWVSGHVDTCLTVTHTERSDDCLWVTVGGVVAEDSWLLAPKGWISVNGVSLTLPEVGEDSFKLLLVPHTLACTNLKHLAPGSRVNVEWDSMAKLVVQTVQRMTERKQ